jgi:hypothetical protein
MDEDDLPPRLQRNENGFATELGGMVGTVVWIGAFLAIAGVVLFFVMRWTGHSPW